MNEGNVFLITENTFPFQLQLSIFAIMISRYQARKEVDEKKMTLQLELRSSYTNSWE